jgi:hypothetical protein
VAVRPTASSATSSITEPCLFNRSSLTYNGINYDGTVNFADLNKVLTNCDLTGPVNINNLPSLVLQSLEADSQAMQLLASDDITVSGTTVVPEPSVLALLAAGLLGLAAWRWRKRQ